MVFVKKSECLSCVSQKRCSVNILDRKERFLDHKSEIVLRPENGNFPKGFFQKIEIFILCVFWANEAR